MSTSSSSKALIAIAALATSASAHLVMTNPVPYSFPTLQVNPLNNAVTPGPIGYPCASNKGVYTVTQENTATAGGTIPVSFEGTAVHGGGTCQFSVTYDETPSEDPSRWKVMHTIIGGCPAEAEGNLVQQGTDADGRAAGPQCGNADGTECLRTFDVPIPADLPNGQATFAWSWFNEVGNREMYMNCAPLTITGGSDDQTFLETLPQMYVINAGTVNGQETCQAPEGTYIIDIPEANRGPSVVVNAEPTAPELPAACGARGAPAKRAVRQPHSRKVKAL